MPVRGEPIPPNHADAPPRVIVIEPDQWARALARASLREMGYDAVGASDLRAAVQQHAAASGRGAVRVVVVDHDALAGVDAEHLERLHTAFGGPAMVLVRRPTRAEPSGPWSAVLSRPLSIGELTATVRELCPLAPEQMRPLDLPAS